MATFRPDPEFWKKLYGDAWESAAQAVITLHKKVIERYPELEDSVQFGLGATTGKKVRIPPGEKHEADIIYYYDYKFLCGIQVSAPQKGRVPPGDIWVLKGKCEQAVSKEAENKKIWFYFDYPLTKKTYALDVPIIRPFEKNIRMQYPRGKPEPYVMIPYEKALPGDALLDWIGQELARRKKS